jgi:hypothetical protein
MSGNFAANVKARKDRRTDYLSNPQFRARFEAILGGKGKVKALPGMDMARGAGQAKARVAGRDNSKKLKDTTSTTAAALQHAARNRSVEQGGNNAAITRNASDGSDLATSIMNLIKSRGGR